MNWSLTFLNEAREDIRKLDHSVYPIIIKGIRKVQQNPLPTNEGGYGKTLQNLNGVNLKGFLKIKFASAGIRVVYNVVRSEHEMKVIVVSARADNEVYKEAAKRINKYHL
ncbi:MAG: type II toxin-antitoxin system RelE/ParE family toxin [Lachnospiraceae bacterium]|nr:type II toxin-antitoxin system RelE/ParE family toxin [Lachnospiraceae bacterium]